jgi:hypothetical protein
MRKNCQAQPYISEYQEFTFPAQEANPGHVLSEDISHKTVERSSELKIAACCPIAKRWNPVQFHISGSLFAHRFHMLELGLGTAALIIAGFDS